MQNLKLVFITQSYFAASKNIRLNSTHCFIMKISNKREFQQITLNLSSEYKSEYKMDNIFMNSGNSLIDY